MNDGGFLVVGQIAETGESAIDDGARVFSFPAFAELVGRRLLRETTAIAGKIVADLLEAVASVVFCEERFDSGNGGTKISGRDVVEFWEGIFFGNESGFNFAFSTFFFFLFALFVANAFLFVEKCFEVILIFFQIDGNSERSGGWQDLVKTIKKQ
jgi:hypothetical protein